ncbi:MAG: response regulator transcription factor [Verrucomicrobiota bacterium]
MSAGRDSRIRLLVVDDHFFVRMGLAGSLNAEPDIRVVAETDNGAQALKLYREHRPDVVLLDGLLPGLSGENTLTALRGEFPDARVLMLLNDDWEEDGFRAMRAGAAGHLPKTTRLPELLRAIRTVHAGGRYHPSFIVPETPGEIADQP